MSRPTTEPTPVGSWAESAGPPRQPSSLYRRDLWASASWAASRLPVGLAKWLGFAAANLYRCSNPARREIVFRNLLPPLHHDTRQARSLTRRLFRQFAVKLVDLWRYENGLPVEEIVVDTRGWEHVLAARGKGRGVLLLTPHLGNWELGAPLLTRRGIPITVVTLDEPDPALTDARRSSRAKWGIETIVVGRNPFAAVEIVRRLENGATVALLMDRPPAASAVEVSLFGLPFMASRAPAELARASGCVLLPVYLPWIGPGYRAEVLPEIVYRREALGSRSARAALTQTITGVFEPVIRQYLDQWYHFVPIWPEPSKP
ncbi:MAG: lysophospholipid acyltransferase family protein [Verrucomicrobiota bacterium]